MCDEILATTEMLLFLLPASLVGSLVVVIVVIIHLNATIFLRLTGNVSTVHTDAGACTEGQKEYALGDEEEAERIAIILPTV